MLAFPRPVRAGFLGSPFPPRSRPGWPASGRGNSPVPWSNKGLVGCGIYSTRSGTDVDDIITTSLCVPPGMLNATSPTGITRAFASLSVVSTGCFREAKLTPIRLRSSKVPDPDARIVGISHLPIKGEESTEHLSGGIEYPDRIRVHAARPSQMGGVGHRSHISHRVARQKNTQHKYAHSSM